VFKHRRHTIADGIKTNNVIIIQRQKKPAGSVFGRAMSQTLKLLLNSRKLRPTYETSLSEGVTVMMGLMQKREEEN
jgi:hypothetical protein